MFDIKDKAAQTAKRAGLISAGGLCCLVGAAFLTLAAWFYLVAVLDPMAAALILAGVYLGLGLILIGVGSSRTAHHPQTPPPSYAAKPAEASGFSSPLVQAFLHGLDAGRRADR